MAEFKTNGDEKMAVSELLLYNLGVHVDIVSTRRLGEPRTGRMQLLQVVLSDASQTVTVLGWAKSLQHSTDETVRTMVYKITNFVAEAKAAFDWTIMIPSIGMYISACLMVEVLVPLSMRRVHLSLMIR